MFLIGIEDKIQISMGIKNSSRDKSMHWLSGQFLNSGLDSFIDREASKVFKQFIVINLFVIFIRYLIRIYDKIQFLFFFLIFDIFSHFLFFFLLVARFHDLFIITKRGKLDISIYSFPLLMI